MSAAMNRSSKSKSNGRPGAERRADWYKKHDYRCTHCGGTYPILGGRVPKKGERFLTIGHVIPKASGGPNAQWNLVPLCNVCNTNQDQQFWPHLWGEHPPAEYDEWRRSNHD